MTLSTKIEQATAPSRELDAEIALLAGLRFLPDNHPFAAFGGCLDANGHGVPLPAYTSSIDAALTLVPDGWAVEIQIPAEGLIFVRLEKASGHGLTCTTGATPALALCAAALKARNPT